MRIGERAFVKAGAVARGVSVVAVAILLYGVFATHAGNVAVSAQEPGGATGSQIGVYTLAQAARGQEKYLKVCSTCHLQDLSGPAPPLVGERFRQQWADRTVAEFYTRIINTMPQDAPSSLGNPAYVDIVAFILQANKFPPGNVELGQDIGLMRTLVFKADTVGQ